MDSTKPASRSTRRCLDTVGCSIPSCRSISPTDCCDETSRLNIARRFGSAMISNTDSMPLIYSTWHMRVTAYKGRTQATVSVGVRGSSFCTDSYVGNYEFQVPIFVLTHHPPSVAPKQDEHLARHRQVHASCEPETGNGHKSRSAKQAPRYGELGYKGVRVLRFHGETRMAQERLICKVGR